MVTIFSYAYIVYLNFLCVHNITVVLITVVYSTFVNNYRAESVYKISL